MHLICSMPRTVFNTLMVSIGHAFRQIWCQFRVKLCESRFSAALLYVVGVVAFGAGPPTLLSTFAPHADAFAVDPIAPTSKDLSMAFATQFLRLIEADLIAEVIR